MHKRSPIRGRWTRLLVAAGAVSFAGADVFGSTSYSWNAGSANWNTAADWSPNGVPGNGDYAYLDEASSGYTVTYNLNAPTATLGLIDIDLSGGTATLLMNNKLPVAVTLVSAYEYVGDFGQGNFTQNIGTNTVTTGLYIGYYNGSDGTYTLNSGTLSAPIEDLGVGGSIIAVQPSGSGPSPGIRDVSSYDGNFNQSGGFNFVSSEIDIGSGNTGEYSNTGGTLNDTGSIYVGGTSSVDNGAGSGTFNISNTAIVNISSTLETYGGSNVVNLSGGTLTTGTVKFQGGISQFNWTGGTLHLTGMQFNVSANDSENDNLYGNSFTLNSGMGLQDDVWEWVFGNGATFTQNSNTSNNMPNFYLGSNGGASSNATYYLNGGTFSTTGNQYLGYLNTFLQGGSGGNGTFNQSGATNTVGGTLYLGFTSGSVANYILSGGSIYAPCEELGYNTSGIFNQTGGGNNLSGTFYLGYTSNGGGTYILGGNGSLTSAGAEYIGFSGTGVVSQTGGSNTVMSGGFLEGYYGGSFGEYLLSGGSLSVTGDEEIGVSSSATVSQSGGTNTIAGGNDLFVGFAGSGTYNLSNTGALVATGNEYICYDSVGSFNQSGGSNSVSYDLIIGAVGGHTGTYTLSGGSLTATLVEWVGEDGVGIFNQSGGTNTLPTGGELDVGTFSGSKGTFLLSGGSTTVNGNAYVGGYSGGAGGTGTLTVSSSGVLTVTGLLSVYAGTANTINLNGGSITAGLINFNNNLNQFNWTSGTLALTNDFVLVDDTSSSENFTNSFKLTAGETLNVVNKSEYAGYQGTGKFNNNGGSNTIGLDLVLGTSSGSTGTYVLGNNGSLNVAVAELVGDGGVGTFNQNSGTNTIASGGDLYLGYNPAGKGTYNLSGGTASINGNIDVGGSGTAAGGSGTFTISGTGQLNASGTLQVWGAGRVNISGQIAQVGGLAISTGGVVNVNSALLINFGAAGGSNPEATIQQYIEGGQIISTQLASDPGFGIAYAAGGDPGLLNANLTTGQAVVELDLLGDADMNGTVNFHDLQDLLGGLGNPGYWDQGNFNNHSVIDFNDLQLLLSNFNNSTTLDYSELSGIENLVGQYGEVAVANPDGVGFTLTSVPEPASIGILAIGGLFLVRRRRDRSA